jgi:hypothetical protein
MPGQSPDEGRSPASHQAAKPERAAQVPFQLLLLFDTCDGISSGGKAGNDASPVSILAIV